MTLEELIFNALGLGLIVLTLYMLTTRVLRPQVLFPWRNRRRKERLTEQAEQLLGSGRLSEDEQLQVRRALNALNLRRDILSQPGTGSDPLDDAQTDIESVWNRHEGEVEDDSSPLGIRGT